MPVQSIPAGFEGATPALAFQGAAEAVAWYQRAFGATEVLRLTSPDGTIAHGEIKIGNALIMLGEEMPPYNKSPKTLGGTTVALNLYFNNVDAAFAQAVEAGAKVVFPLNDQFYGDRSGRIEDPFGYVWILSQRKEEMTVAEMQRRFDEWLKQQSAG